MAQNTLTATTNYFRTEKSTKNEFQLENPQEDTVDTSAFTSAIVATLSDQIATAHKHMTTTIELDVPLNGIVSLVLLTKGTGQVRHMRNIL